MGDVQALLESPVSVFVVNTPGVDVKAVGTSAAALVKKALRFNEKNFAKSRKQAIATLNLLGAAVAP